LDIGAGAGVHSLVLQEQGLDVAAVEISHYAADVMKRRGVKNVRVGDMYDTYYKLFDTVLVICNIGIVGNLEGLDRFLGRLSGLLCENGRLITDSFDPVGFKDEIHK
jgi:cyclopropane fatty-acyl-phospholipid synthase-like methyltransferase